MSCTAQQHVQQISTYKTPAERLRLSHNNPLLRHNGSIRSLATWLSDQISLVPGLDLIQKVCSAVIAHPLSCKFERSWPTADTRAAIVSAKIASDPWLQASLQQSKGLDAYFNAQLIAIRMRPKRETSPLWFSAAASGRGPLSHEDFLASCSQAESDAIASYFQKKVPNNDPIFLLECYGHYFVRNGTTGPYIALNAPAHSTETPLFPAELCCHLPSLPGWFPCTLWPVGYNPADTDLGYTPSFSELWPYFDTPPSYSIIPLDLTLVAPKSKKDPLQAKLNLAFVLSPTKTSYITITRPLHSLAHDLTALFPKLHLAATHYHDALLATAQAPELFDVSFYPQNAPSSTGSNSDTTSLELRIAVKNPCDLYICAISLDSNRTSATYLPVVHLSKRASAGTSEQVHHPLWIQKELTPILEKYIAEQHANSLC